jgi:hypothetical protein
MNPDVVAYAEARLRQRNQWDGVKYTEFCKRCGITLQPGQLAFALVAYDGLEPRDLPTVYVHTNEDGAKEVHDLRAIGYQLFGQVEAFAPECRRIVVLIAGGRGGKSSVLAAYRAVHAAVTTNIDSLGPGEEAYAVIVAPDPRQREQCYNFARGLVESVPELKSMLDGEPSNESFTIKRRTARGVAKVTVDSLPAKRGGTAGRGRSLVFAALEECAFFMDDNKVVNDVDIYTAITPRLLPGAQALISTTPWLEAGLAYKEFVDNHPNPACAAPHLKVPGRPHRAIAAHAPTLLLRNVRVTREQVAAETARDPTNAAREHGAQFMQVGTSAFFDPALIAAAVDPGLRIGTRPQSEGSVCARGVDLGFVNDAAVGLDVERTAAGYAVLNWDEIFASVEKLRPSQVLERLASGAIGQGIEEMVCDQHYAETAKEDFAGRGLVFVGVPQDNDEMFSVLRNIMHEGQLRLPNDARLLEQLRSVRKRPLSGGRIKIELPRTKKGGHCDLVSALVHAVWRLYTAEVPEIVQEEPDVLKREAQAWTRQVKERIQQEESSDDDFDPYKQNGWMLR